MNYIIYLEPAALALSLGLNLYLYFRKQKSSSQTSYDATMMLHDMTKGAALVKVTRVAPEEILIRSPRGLS